MTDLGDPIILLCAKLRLLSADAHILCMAIEAKASPETLRVLQADLEATWQRTQTLLADTRTR